MLARSAIPLYKNNVMCLYGGKMKNTGNAKVKNENTPLYTSTHNQESYLHGLSNKKVTIAHGPAGTGKTMLACAHAIQELDSGMYRKVIITRPAVALDEEHGYLPGDLNEKMLPWMIPIYDNFMLFTTKTNLDYYIDSGKIEIAPLSFIRGRTFHNTLIIADEMQNSTENQMKTLLTRIGTESCIIITGDLQQCDLELGKTNGLLDFIERLKNYSANTKTDDDFICVIELDTDDIHRSETVKHILEIYNHDMNGGTIS